MWATSEVKGCHVPATGKCLFVCVCARLAICVCIVVTISIAIFLLVIIYIYFCCYFRSYIISHQWTYPVFNFSFSEVHFKHNQICTIFFIKSVAVLLPHIGFTKDEGSADIPFKIPSIPYIIHSVVFKAGVKKNKKKKKKTQ